jgi:hypothetical protein
MQTAGPVDCDICVLVVQLDGPPCMTLSGQQYPTASSVFVREKESVVYDYVEDVIPNSHRGEQELAPIDPPAEICPKV